MTVNLEKNIITIVLEHFPEVQAIYHFGSTAKGQDWPDSDIDVAILLPFEQAKSEKNLLASECCSDLENTLKRSVDLLNARIVSTVFQKEIISGKLILCQNRFATDEFEMLTLSYYQKLNHERKEILNAFAETGRAFNV